MVQPTQCARGTRIPPGSAPRNVCIGKQDDQEDEALAQFATWAVGRWDGIRALFGGRNSSTGVLLSDFESFLSIRGYQGDASKIYRLILLEGGKEQQNERRPKGGTAGLFCGSGGSSSSTSTSPSPVGVIRPNLAHLSRFERRCQAIGEPRGPGADAALVGRFVSTLRERRGSCLRAWRLDLDKRGAGRVAYVDFVSACAQLPQTVKAQALWSALHPDGESTPLEFFDLDPEESRNVDQFLEALWTEVGFDLDRAWAILDPSGRGQVSLQDFVRGVARLGFRGDARKIFLGLDTSGLGHLWRNEFNYLWLLSLAPVRSHDNARPIRTLCAWAVETHGSPAELVERLGFGRLGGKPSQCDRPFDRTLPPSPARAGCCKRTKPQRSSSPPECSKEDATSWLDNQGSPTAGGPGALATIPQARFAEIATDQEDRPRLVSRMEFAACVSALGFQGDIARALEQLLPGTPTCGPVLRGQLQRALDDRRLFPKGAEDAAALVTWIRKEIGCSEALLYLLDGGKTPKGSEACNISIDELEVASVQAEASFCGNALSTAKSELDAGVEPVKELTVGDLAARLTALGYPGNAMVAASVAAKGCGGSGVVTGHALLTLLTGGTKSLGSQEAPCRGLGGNAKGAQPSQDVMTSRKDHGRPLARPGPSTCEGVQIAAARKAATTPPPPLRRQKARTPPPSSRPKPEWDDTLFLGTVLNEKRPACSRSYFSDASGHAEAKDNAKGQRQLERPRSAKVLGRRTQ